MKHIPKNELAELFTEGRFKCRKCLEIKSLTDFRKDTSKKWGYATMCKPCKAQGDRDYQRNRRKNKRGGTFYRRYIGHYDEQGNWINVGSIAFEEAKRIYGECCNICGSSNKLVVDHCHKTGDIRGLLCHACNVGIGWLKDDLAILNNAITYLSERPIKATKVS